MQPSIGLRDTQAPAGVSRMSIATIFRVCDLKPARNCTQRHESIRCKKYIAASI